MTSRRYVEQVNAFRNELGFHAQVEYRVAELTSDESFLALLATSPDAIVRRKVIENPRTPAATLLMLVDDEDYTNRRALLYHPSTPPAALALLAAQDDPYGYFPRLLVDNPATPLEAFCAVSAGFSRAELMTAVLKRTDVDDIVRFWSVGDENFEGLPIAILRKLYLDSDLP